MAPTAHFHVSFTGPNGFEYRTSANAAGEADAVQLADEELEFTERIGISDFLEPDGTSVRPPARLTVERIEDEGTCPVPDLVVIDPHGKRLRE